MARTKERRQKKKALRNGIPSFHAGGIVEHTGPFSPAQQTAFSVTAQGQPKGGHPPLSANNQVGQQQSGTTFELLPNGETLMLIDGVPFQILSRPPAGPGGGGSATPQFRPGELEFMQQQLAQDKELQEAQLALNQGQLELNQLIQQQQNAIAKGQLQLAKQIEARIAEMEKRQFRLDQFIQQRQQQIEQTLGGAQGLAGIGSSLGNIEVQRSQFLSQLAANPRDFEQLQIALGGGSSFLDAISQGQRPEGQGINRAQENLPLGQGFLDLLSAVTARPELDFFNKAGDAFSALLPAQLTPEGFSGVPRQFKHGGQLVTDEPIVGMGMRSGKARFTLGEPTAQFPQGAPEALNITPIGGAGGQGGGQPLPEDILRDIPGPQPPTQVPFDPGRGIAPLPTGGPFTPPPPKVPVGPNQTPGPLSIEETLTGFGDTTFTTDLLRAAQQPGAELPPAPLTPGQQVAQIMSSFQPIDFFSMLPSARANLESRISALGFPPEDIFAEFLRNLPTGANPNAISFGNFSGGGTVLNMRPGVDFQRVA